MAEKHASRYPLTFGVTSRMLLCIQYIVATNPDFREQKNILAAIQADKSSISRWRSGDGNVTLENVLLMRKHFKIDYNYLMDGIGTMFGSGEIMQELEMLKKRVTKIEKQLSIKK